MIWYMYIYTPKQLNRAFIFIFQQDFFHRK